MENLLTCQTNSLNLFFKKIVGAPETTEFVCGLMINKLIERYPASRGYIFAVWAVVQKVVATFRTPAHTTKL